MGSTEFAPIGEFLAFKSWSPFKREAKMKSQGCLLRRSIYLNAGAGAVTCIIAFAALIMNMACVK